VNENRHIPEITSTLHQGLTTSTSKHIAFRVKWKQQSHYYILWSQLYVLH